MGEINMKTNKIEEAITDYFGKRWGKESI